MGKRAVGYAAADLVTTGMCLGLGTGSTFRFVLDRLAERCRNEDLQIRGVPTSEGTADYAKSLGIPLISLDDVQHLDLAIDGADEVDPAHHLIKGGGAALTREKLVAAAAKRFVVIVDAAKLVQTLGAAFPLPVEVLPFGWTHTARRIAAIGCEPRRRMAGADEPVVTDNGNYVLDCHGPGIPDPEAFARRLDGVPGVVEHGLFCGMAHEVLVADASGAVNSA